MSDPISQVGELEELRAHLLTLDVFGIAEELAHMDQPGRATAFRLLPKDLAMQVFQYLDAAHQEELLHGMKHEQVIHLVENLDPDDRARLFDEMPAAVVKRVLAGLSPAEQRMTSLLLGYPEDSAGRVMTPEFLQLRSWMSVSDALERIRRRGRKTEMIYVLPVTDEELRLIGMVHLKDLVLASAEQKVTELMDPNPRFAQVDEDRERAARLIQTAHLLALPVVDLEKRVVGIITVDDAMDILGEEETEDLARTGGAEPLGRPYFSVSVFRLARSRVVWLLVLVVAATLTVNVMSYFEETLAAVVTLALFIPLLIDTGGNCGSQSATTMVRSLATDEVRFGDLLRIAGRESLVGFFLGAMLGALSILPVWWFAGGAIAAVVSLTLLTVCTLATMVGALLPLLAHRAGVDPAVASAPFVTTFVDATGLLVYFMIAGAILQF